MSTKENLLKLLEENPGQYLSGEALAEKLGVSRAAVCKAVKSLKTQGYEISAVTNKGYCLLSCPDLIELNQIRGLLKDESFSLTLLSQVPSTNSFLRELEGQGAPEGTVVLSESQTAGRGRMGRSFYSPAGTGLYMSLLIRPADLTPGESLRITTLAAAALCITIEEVTGLSPRIKWVNDLYLNDRKICGILTEASFSMESGAIDYAVLGLGLNLYPPAGGFPPELSQIAGSLLESPQPGIKNRIISGFLRHFKDFYRNKKFLEAAKIYRSRSFLTGKTVLVGEKKTPAQVLGIDDSCRLLLKYPDGSEQALSFGEVFIVN